MKIPRIFQFFPQNNRPLLPIWAAQELENLTHLNIFV